MKFSIAQWEFSIFLDYRGKRKEHNILNARRKAEKRLQVSQYKKKIGCFIYKIFNFHFVINDLSLCII